MVEKCCHSQVRATHFSSRCPLCLGVQHLASWRVPMSPSIQPEVTLCPTKLGRSLVPVLPRVANHYIRPDHDFGHWFPDKYLVRMNPNYGGFKADAGQPIKHGHPRQSAYHLFPYAQAFFFQSMTPYCILWFYVLQSWHNFISGRKPLNSHNICQFVAVFNLHRQIPRNAFYAHTHLFKVLSAP